tara:strand:+ start:312 stop:617 length:306 start_codon:yes stop_codon:yes gene_type:complete
MTNATAKPMQHLNLTYSGNGKYTVTWQGWPSDGSKTVRKVIHTEYDNTSDVAPKAAQLFADWLETGPMGKGHKAIIELVTYAHIKADKTAVGVSINWETAQ